MTDYTLKCQIPQLILWIFTSLFLLLYHTLRSRSILAFKSTENERAGGYGKMQQEIVIATHYHTIRWPVTKVKSRMNFTALFYDSMVEKKHNLLCFYFFPTLSFPSVQLPRFRINTAKEKFFIINYLNIIWETFQRNHSSMQFNIIHTVWSF